MARKKKRKNQRKKPAQKKGFSFDFEIPPSIKRLIEAGAIFLITLVIFLSFFNLAGKGGEMFMKCFTFLLGKAVFILPLFLVLVGVSLLFDLERIKYKEWPIILATVFLTVGLSGFLESFFQGKERVYGGWIGYVASFPFLKIFGRIVTEIIFLSMIIIGGAIFWYMIYYVRKKERKVVERFEKIEVEKPSLVKKLFKVKPIEEVSQKKEKEIKKEEFSFPLLKKERELQNHLEKLKTEYHFPPVDLLEKDKEIPSAGDIKANSFIIKRTLQNFGIEVEMGEVNIGPTVTQYTLKPAQGIKLSRITALSNDLALALASHPIRIEAPIPGKSLVGIEVPNKVRAMVRLRNLIEHPDFQNSLSNLTIALGRDVSGKPVFADLARMPHLLVAGSTGTGKTICLNSIILSLLYQNSPEVLRFILVDPKRVEFSLYKDLPHLLCPVIFDAQKTVNALKWLIEEMERRFDILSAERARDILSFNEKMLKKGEEPLPYIVLIVDELADLMAARGREIEAGIVRLAQMARAVGIHLIVATQRPSVEVITGLIKANITSRITFQVASQVDSRTVLDTAGAEKLLGRGDMLYLSPEIGKPKRIQGAYVSEKEVKKVVKFIIENNQKFSEREKEMEKEGKVYADLSQSLKDSLEKEGEIDMFGGEEGEDPLYERAKEIVIEAGKASASLLQRRLRIGYARAARLIDMLEERGVVGPADGAKPREVYIQKETDDGFKKI